MHNKNNSTLIKANFIKTAKFLEDLIGGILIVEYERVKKKQMQQDKQVLAFGEAPVRYKIELIERDL